ncbi:class I SAM-dependent methyltransferase [Thalassotalea agarivorans]
MFNTEGRRRKAETMVRVSSDVQGPSLKSLSVLNIGGSSGIIDDYLSQFFSEVTCIDIDHKAITFAKENFEREGLHFIEGDALNTGFPSDKFDTIICSQVYEHVADANQLVKEMYRILKPGGKIYFAAGNRIMFNEPHYNLPLLSVLPRFFSHLYLRAFGKGKYYYEKHLTYWGLKKLVKEFELIDYTKKILAQPSKFGAEYMIKPGTIKYKVANFVAKYFFWLVPGYVWVLKKPDNLDTSSNG